MTGVIMAVWISATPVTAGWATVEGKQVLRVTNSGKTPIAVAEVNGRKTFAELAASPGATMRVGGVWLVENLGPIARAPLPPKWDWKGSAKIAGAFMVPPGAARDMAASGVDSGPIALKWADLGKAKVLVLAQPSFQKVPANRNGPFGKFEPAATLEAEYVALKTWPASADAIVPGGAAEIGAEIVLWPVAIDSADWAKLKTEELRR
ncbi:MAG: hypothetical protein IT381_13480 [Deltaproteobacteria bacterium]|nr:hypothetical protein [Deltaproteobacteria bacterium]